MVLYRYGQNAGTEAGTFSGIHCKCDQNTKFVLGSLIG